MRLTVDMLIHELKQVPPDQWLEVKRFLQSLKPKKTKEAAVPPVKPLSFAGLFSDFNDSDFEEFKEELAKTRRESFNRNDSL